MKTPCEDGGKDQSNVSINQAMPRINKWPPPEARERQGKILPYRFQREHGSADILNLDFQTPEL